LGLNTAFGLRILAFIGLDVGLEGKTFDFSCFGEVFRLSREHFRRSRDSLRQSCESFEETRKSLRLSSKCFGWNSECFREIKLVLR